MAVSVLNTVEFPELKRSKFHDCRQRFTSWNFPSEFYYLIVFTQTRDINTTEINDIFMDCYKQAMLNVNVLAPYTDETMMLATYDPFERDCMKLTRRNLAIVSEMVCELSESLEEVYPVKGLNMNKCPLIVATFPSEPFVIIQEASNTTNDAIAEGVEIELLNQMAKVLNFTVHFRTPPDNQKRGVITHNGTSTGCFKMVNSSI